jgi:hypothetical protein
MSSTNPLGFSATEVPGRADGEPSGARGPVIWVVCPSFRDTAAFTVLRDQLIDVCRDTDLLGNMPVRWVVVDDTGGMDPEVGSIASLSDVQVVTPPFNIGHQRAIVLGLRSTMDQIADDDLVVTMDADGEDRPEDLPRLLAPLLEGPNDKLQLCVAMRTRRQESFRFRAMYVGFRLLFKLLTGTTVRSGNFAAYRGRLARRMLQHPYFDLCYSSSLVALEFEVVGVPCPRGARYAGKSRMNLLKLVMHGIRMLMPFTDRIAIRALMTFSLVFVLGCLLGLAVIGIRIFTSNAIPGWATATLLGIMVISFLALANFVVLFTSFTHSRGISLSGLEDSLESGPRRTSSSAV